MRVEKLRAKPSELNTYEAERAMEERRARASELLAHGDDDLSAADVDELKRLNDELEALEAQHSPVGLSLYGGGNIAMRHPGSAGRPGITRETAVLESSESFAEWTRVHGLTPPARSAEKPNFGQWLKGVVTGEYEGPQMQASLGEGAIGTGGALVPAPLSGELIDLARTKARVIQAGARTVPMTSQTLAIARLAGDPGSAWKAEGAAVAAPTDPTFERVTLTARTLIGLVRASRELIEDAVNMDSIIRNAFAEALARKLDKAALYGSGVAPEPQGVKGSSGISTVSMGTNGGQLTNFDRFVDQAQALWDANFDGPSGWIMAPRTKAAVAKLKDTTNQPLQPPADIADVPRYETTQVPVNLTQGTSNIASDLFGARWPELLIGMRTNIQIEVLRERYAADNFELGFLAHLRADIQLAHPAAFAVTVGIIP